MSATDGIKDHTKPELAPAVADQMARDYYDQFVDGELSEENLRGLVAGLVHRANIHYSVAFELRTSIDRQRLHDLAEDLGELLTRKILVPADNGFDVHRMDAVSVTGWARQMCRTARRARLAYRNGSRSQRIDLIDTTDPVEALRLDSLAAATDETIGATIESSDERILNALDDFHQESAYSRGAGRTEHSVNAVAKGLNLAFAVRLRSYSDRMWLLNEIKNNPRAARRAANDYFNINYRDADPETVESDPRMIALWANQDEESAATLATLPVDVAVLLAEGANAPRRRPTGATLRKIRRRVRQLNRQDPAWRNIVEVLVDSYVATECEAYSAFAPLTDDQRKSREAAATIARSQAAKAVEWAADFDGSPLGATGERVWTRLGLIVDEVEAEEAAA